MRIEARWALPEDVPELVRMYPGLESEQGDLRDMWPLADGLAAPVEQTLAAIVADADMLVAVGTIDDVPFGFIHATIDGLLPQAEGLEIGVVRHIYVESEARGVGIGEAMLGLVLDDLRERGLTRFDARVSPGHRNAKNFFEANGFSARLIVMHNPGR